jgi:hypothetical protein
VQLLSISKIEIKHKVHVDKVTFYTFNVLNARVLRQNFLIYLLK